jgi:hypothetical protein
LEQLQKSEGIMYIYYGPTCGGLETKEKPFDFHCPYMGQGLNTWKSNCEAKQKDKTNSVCYGGCRHIKILRGDPVKKLKPKQIAAIVGSKRQKVEQLANLGMSREEIITAVGLHRTTVNTYLREGRKEGKIK